MELIDQYTYRVFWSTEDEMFVGTCSEFATLSHLDESPEAALRGIREVVRDGVAVLLEDGETPPQPLSMQNFSGKFTVRVPPELHRKLVEEATESNVSLNRLVSLKLAS